MIYAPETPASVHRAAALAAARHFGTEAVTTRSIAQDRTDQVVAYRIDGRTPGGWDVLGDSVLVTVIGDVVAISVDE